MKNTLLFSLVLTVTTLTIGPAQAQVYQWKDENGRTVVSDTPPPGKYKAQRHQGAATSTVAPASASAPAAAPKTGADKEMDFKKRQQETKEKEEKEAKEKAEAETRKRNCAQAQQALRTLESNERIASINEKGERVLYDEQRRKAEAEQARQAAAEWCKP